MPLVYRTAKHKTTTTMAVPTQVYVKYIHPSRMTATETAVPLKKISDRQLRELADLYPDEYLEACLQRGLEPQPKKPRSAVANNLVEEDESQPLERPLGAPHVRPNLQPQSPSRTRMPMPRGAKLPDDLGNDPDLDDLDDLDGAPATAQSDVTDELEAMFTSLPVGDAKDFIVQASAQGRSKVLARLAAAEQARPVPRKSVLKAFESAGVVLELGQEAGDDEESPL